MKTVLTKSLLLTSTLLLFTACGGGTTEYDKKHYTGNPPRDNVGTFIDSGVEGLQYQRPSGIESLTKAGGAFYYKLGETINFHIGNLDIGTTFALNTTTPKDIVSYDERDLNTSIYEPEVNNRVRMLMSLDEDNNPNNGILIPETTREDARFWSTPDYSLSPSDFDTNFASVTNKTITVTKADAELHFTQTLRCAYSGAYRGYQLLPTGGEGPLVGVMIQSNGGIVALGTEQDINNDGVFNETLYSAGTHDMDSGTYIFNSTYQFDAINGTIVGSQLPVTGNGASFGYNKVAGSFVNQGQEGSYVAYRVGDGKNTAYRYTGYGYSQTGATETPGVGNDPLLGLFTLDIDTKGVVTGMIHDAQTNLEPDLTGHVDLSTNIADIDLTLGGNQYKITGIIDFTGGGTLRLRWADTNDNKLGYLDGFGCQLQVFDAN